MSKGDNSPGMSKLAGVIVGAAQNASEASVVLDFGVIQGDGCLLTNTYPLPIPASDYQVCRGVGLPNSEVITSYDTIATNKSHKHKFEEGLLLEGITDVQSSPAAHAHATQADLTSLETEYTTSTQNPHPHQVDIARPSQRRLQAGDHVLVAWVYNDAVVVDILMSAIEIFGNGVIDYG